MISKLSNDDWIGNKILSFLVKKKVKIALDIDYGGKSRSAKNGIEFLNTQFELNYKGDHTPMLSLFIGVCNFKFLDLEIYNVFHEEDEVIVAPYKLEPHE